MHHQILVNSLLSLFARSSNALCNITLPLLILEVRSGQNLRILFKMIYGKLRILLSAVPPFPTDVPID